MAGKECPTRGTLVLLACHGVYDSEAELLHGDFPDDFPVYAAQLQYAAQHIIWQKCLDPLLIYSGGYTRSELRCSESRSYVDWARRLGVSLAIEPVLEEYALTSVDNLLLGCYRYHQIRRCYPARIDVVSWAFKGPRFQASQAAIHAWRGLPEAWPTLNFFPVGDLPEPMRPKAAAAEQQFIKALAAGLETYYSMAEVRSLVARRDVWQTRGTVHEFYAGYPLPFAE